MILPSKSSFKEAANQQLQVDTKVKEIKTGSDWTLTFRITYQPDGCLMNIFSKCTIFPVHHTQKVGAKLTLLNPTSFSIPNCCTVMSCYLALNFIGFLLHIFSSGNCFRSGWSIVYIFLSFKSIGFKVKYLFAHYCISMMLSIHKWHKRLRAVKPCAQGYNRVLQDLSFLVSCPILRLLDHKKVIEH